MFTIAFCRAVASAQADGEGVSAVHAKADFIGEWAAQGVSLPDFRADVPPSAYKLGTEEP